MRSCIIAFSAILLVSNVAFAQNPFPPKPNPEEMQKALDSTMGAMLPMVGRMAEVQIEAQLRMGERPETAERIATFKRNLFDALRSKGFTESQSLQIASSTSFPSASGK